MSAGFHQQGLRLAAGFRIFSKAPVGWLLTGAFTCHPGGVISVRFRFTGFHMPCQAGDYLILPSRAPAMVFFWISLVPS